MIVLKTLSFNSTGIFLSHITPGYFLMQLYINNACRQGLDKATGPDDLPIEAVKILAKQDIGYVVEAMNQVLQQGIPEVPD